MSLISQEDQEFLKDYFAKELANPVKIIYFTQHKSPLMVPSNVCMSCNETSDLLTELSALSDKIQVVVKDLLADDEEAKALGVERIPATIITGATKGQVRFFGIPSGYEFASLVEAIADAGKGGSDLKDSTKQKLAGLTKDVHIQVFVTPT